MAHRQVTLPIIDVTLNPGDAILVEFDDLGPDETNPISKAEVHRKAGGVPEPLPAEMVAAIMRIVTNGP
jgi:hypothetical protein